MSSEICLAGAVDLARLIRTKQLSAREVMTAHLERISQENPRVNAIVTLADDAMKAAAAADEAQARGDEPGPLHGLPVAHKDLFETRGIRTTFGSTIYKDYVPQHDDPVVEQMRLAGAITIGKTNTPEFGAGSQTFNPIFGATRNPYDVSKTCGGSSGGSAAALVCGFAPLATGTDVGGSLRNPAAYCSVVGMRTSADALNTVGCMGRSVADLALGMSALGHPEWREPLHRDFRGVRVAWFKDLGGMPFDAEVRSIVNSRRSTFEALGCIVEEGEPDLALAETAFRVLRAASSAALRASLLEEHPGAFKTTLKREIEQGLALSPEEVARAEADRAELRRRCRVFFETYEYFVLPTVQLPPFDVDIEYPTGLAGIQFDSYIDWMKSCWYISATGHPAISVPAGFTAGGLPVGLQIVGRSMHDFAVLQMAHAFAQAAS